MTPFKGRTPDPTRPVEVYRCLPRKGKVYSVRQAGLVVGHTEAITLRDVEFVVHLASRERARASRTRNVHAFLRGHLTDESPVACTEPVGYHPFLGPAAFTVGHLDGPICSQSPAAQLRGGRLFIPPCEKN